MTALHAPRRLLLTLKLGEVPDHLPSLRDVRQEGRPMAQRIDGGVIDRLLVHHGGAARAVRLHSARVTRLQRPGVPGARRFDDIEQLSGVARVRIGDTPQDWVRLVSAYPMEVTASRQHDWRRAAGATGCLLQPDYRAASRDWDAVHVSVRGYLTTAMRALPVDGATTVLAGWSPDETWWLTDCLAVTGPAVTRTFTRG